MTEQTKITLQDMIDRGLNPAGWTVVADGAGNFILTEPSGGGGGGAEQIGIYALQDGVPLGTGTWLNVGDNLKASLSGTVIALDGFAPGVDQIGVFLQDEGIGQATGTILNFVGSEVTVSVSGTIAQIAVGDPAGGTGTTVVFDEDSLVGSFSEMRYKGDGVDVYNSGTYAAIAIPGGGAGPYRVRARRTSTNNFVNGYTISWQTTDWNDLDMWTGTAPTRITIPSAGVVQVDCTAGFDAAGGSGRWWMAIYHNASQKFYHSDHVSDWNASPHASVGGSYEVAANDYFEVQLWNLSGSGKNSSTSCNITLLFWPD